MSSSPELAGSFCNFVSIYWNPVWQLVVLDISLCFHRSYYHIEVPFFCLLHIRLALTLVNPESFSPVRGCLNHHSSHMMTHQCVHLCSYLYCFLISKISSFDVPRHEILQLGMKMAPYILEYPKSLSWKNWLGSNI